ncbi:hypothetical protein PPACK8108_LOCUS21132 [Phakopsora pachyrhizi]|uniref:Uncharacterized protein n=1 Tax=Phakopsora pachyrhizi TaxID=170000 RepID=A0AAV0BK56_PHAPC|nr:hypothetical protein PPACK8108_LOCUS21132 [Phakopsora pachyrhizi]
MIPPSVRLIISFLLVFTVGIRISFRNIFTGTSPFIIVIQFPWCVFLFSSATSHFTSH